MRILLPRDVQLVLGALKADCLACDWKRELRPLNSRALKSSEMKSPNKVTDLICNMENEHRHFDPRHRIVSATTSPSRAACGEGSISPPLLFISLILWIFSRQLLPHRYRDAHRHRDTHTHNMIWWMAAGRRGVATGKRTGANIHTPAVRGPRAP